MAGGDSDPASELHVGDPAIILELPQNPAIDGVKASGQSKGSFGRFDRWDCKPGPFAGETLLRSSVKYYLLLPHLNGGKWSACLA